MQGEYPSQSKGKNFDIQSKTPPHHLEAERSILGSILVQNEAIDIIRETGLEPSDFYKESHAKIFEVACALNDRREPVDLVTLSQALKDRGWAEAVGGTQTLTGLFEDAFAIGNVAYYAKIVHEKAMVRKTIQACTSIIADAFDGVEDIETFLNEAESQIFSVSNVKNTKSFTDLKTVLLENMASIEELALRKEDVTGLPTGFHSFDMLTTGLHPGQVLILAARPGMGKTSWILSSLQHAVLEKKACVAFFSLEMSKEELGFRMISGLSRIDSKRLKQGKLADREWKNLAEAADKLSKAKVFIDDSGGLTVTDLRSRCRRLLSLEGKLDLIVIDYLQLMRGSRKKKESSREQEISEISRNLKELAKELKVPIVALSQLNRGVESRQDKRPNLSDLRESGAIEQDADMVCFIHREDYYDRESENKDIAELIVAKNRSGPTDTVNLRWIANYTLFTNLENEMNTSANSFNSVTSSNTKNPKKNYRDNSDITL